MSDHLDNWRVLALDGGAFAFGPVHLAPRFTPAAGAFVAALAPTPKHGMLWSDAEARGLMDAQISKEATRRTRQINAPWRDAVCARAGVERYVAPLVRSVTMHGKGTPMCIVINSGMAWAEAFLAAIEGGISAEEVQRLNAFTGLKFTRKALAKPDGLKTRCEVGDLYVSWKGRTTEHPLHRALFALSLMNGDTPFDWGDIQLTFNWGWLQDRKRYAAAVLEYLGEQGARRLGLVRNVTVEWSARPATPR